LIVVAARVEKAPAKVNLTLRITGRRRDGYHEIDSLVAFAGPGDVLKFMPGSAPTLAVTGPTAGATGRSADNLVLKAALALAARVEGLRLGHFTLSKRLPVAAGLGGGSADAGAALRILARVNGLALGDARLFEAARATGADVPVCLDPRPRRMRGIGDVLSEPLQLPSLPAILINPGVPLATKHVFAALNPASFAARSVQSDSSAASLLDEIINEANDLEAPAIKLAPVIADVLRALRSQAGCRLARMSGSGATCFGLFASMAAANAASRKLRAGHAGWWVRATTIGALEQARLCQPGEA
jgi:4-diphosphocytidyl-2-C-methyl-D-erythritol kinase